MFEINRNNMKPFSYSVSLKDFVFHENEIELKEMTITISSPNTTFMMYLFNGLQQLNIYNSGLDEWYRVRMRLLPEVNILSKTAYFKTLSPILIESKEGKPLHPTDHEYAEAFNYYASLRIKELSGRDPIIPINITPGRMTKVVIKESNATFRNIENKQFLYFTAYKGKLQITGHPTDLQLLYSGGVGKRASQAFGLLEYAGEEV
jgi:CRISPR-associated endoribonuclease Cas6